MQDCTAPDPPKSTTGRRFASWRSIVFADEHGLYRCATEGCEVVVGNREFPIRHPRRCSRCRAGAPSV